MKNLKIVTMLMLLNLPTFALAQTSGSHGVTRAGDPCDKRFKEIRDNLATWITVDNWKGLKFSITDNVANYKADMLSAIGAATISCTSDKVYVDNIERTCSNTVDSKGGITILCNYPRFMNPSATDDLQKGLGEDNESIQYGLVHHEYAGATGFEIGNYHLSEQLSHKLTNVMVKRLPIVSVLQ